MTIVLVDGGEVEAGLGWNAITYSPGTAPSAPQALAADNGAVNPSDIVVTCTEPADNGEWSIDEYEVELTATLLQEFMPAMTANNAPAPYVVSASGVLIANTYEPWKAFNDQYVPASPTNQTTGWYSQDSTPPWWLKVDLGSQKQIVGFYWSKTMTTHQYAVDHFPKAWQLQGSNDNSVWTTVHSETAYAMSGTGFDMYVPVSTPGSYRYYRWWITGCQAVGMTHVGIDEIRLVEGDEPTVEVKTNTSSPITFSAEPFGKTYSIRARAKNRVGWGPWTSSLQYTHTA